MARDPQLNSSETDELLMGLVDLALARPPEERERFLRAACADKPGMFATAWGYVEWEQRMQGFLLDPLIPQLPGERRLNPGDLLQGRFRIVREVAQGGMGIVYEAWDEKLARRIAIKCAKAGFRKRLPPEVRNASDISHPNVCKIFEIHTASLDGEEFDFLTMEYLEGETLGERMRRGPIGKKEAKTIALQLCEGLAEAHRNQVIHGDLKSTNVILAAAPGGGLRAAITDFGLARRPAAAEAATQSSQQAGTPDYMAPELLKGGKVSIASDLYALGVILYQLAAGRPPFAQDASWEERCERRPPALKHRWNATLQRCLDPDPARRLHSAADVARAIGPAKTRPRVLAAAALLLAALTYIVATQRARAPAESVRLALLPFQAAPDAAVLADGLARDTALHLARLKGNSRTKLTVIPLENALRRNADTAEKAKILLGATHALQARLRRENDRVILQAYLTDTRSQVNAKEWKAEYASGELRYVPVALAGMTTGTLRLPPLGIGAVVNEAARPEYAAGLSHLRRESGADAALACFERAAALDPESPLTYAALAEARWLKYFTTRDSRWLDLTVESVNEAERRGPDTAAVHRVAGLLHANAGSFEPAAAEYRRAIELEPKHVDAYRRLGIAHERNGQADEALAAYRRGLEVEPGDYRTYQAMGALFNTRANYAEAARHFEKAVALAPDEPAAHFALATAYSKSGRFAEAEDRLRQSIGLKETPTAWHTLGTVLMYQGKDRDAIACITRALDGWPERSLWWMNLGIAYRRVNDASRSESANRRGLSAVEKEIAQDPRAGKTRSLLAFLCARLGDRRRAESEMAQALHLSPDNADTRWAAALTCEALGRREETLAVLQGASREVLAELSRWPDVADLHRDSRFQKLLASREIR